MAWYIYIYIYMRACACVCTCRFLTRSPTYLNCVLSLSPTTASFIFRSRCRLFRVWNDSTPRQTVSCRSNGPFRSSGLWSSTTTNWPRCLVASASVRCCKSCRWKGTGSSMSRRTSVVLPSCERWSSPETTTCRRYPSPPSEDSSDCGISDCGRLGSAHCPTRWLSCTDWRWSN